MESCCEVSGGGDNGRLSMLMWPGEGEPLGPAAAPRDIFSLMARRRTTSASTAWRRAWSCRFVFSNETM